MHERELQRKLREDHDASQDVATPGRASASASLLRRDQPMASGLLMRKASGGTVDGDAMSAVDQAAGSSGHGLPDELRGRFESSLGTDLSSVRLHTGADSAAAASAVAARAYTLGNDIHFGANQYDPHSTDGQRLIAHEVAHTVQQRGATAAPQYKLEVSSAGDAFEVEADRAADAMISGAPATVGGASRAIMRQEGASPAKDGGGGDGEKADKPRYPSWKDSTINLPFGKFGNFAATYGDKPSVKVSFANTASHTLAEKKYTKHIQIYPGIIGTITGSVGIQAEASGEVTGGGEWVPVNDSNEKAASLTIAGTGTVSVSGKGALQLSLGAGVAGVLGITGGIEGAIEAKASASATIAGAITRNPDGSEKGVVDLIVGIGAELAASASLKVDIVTPTDPVNVYSQELGKLPLATASIKCPVQYKDGNVTSLPPEITFELLPPPPMEQRERRKREEHEKTTPPKNATDDGASGNHPGVELEDDEVDMSDEEIFAAGEQEAAKALRNASQVELPMKSTSGLNGAMPVSVVIDGVPVRGLCFVSPEQAQRDRERGKEATAVHAGYVASWSCGFVPSDIVKNNAKNRTAVAHAILRNHIDLVVVGTSFEYKDVPMVPCLAKPGATSPAIPMPSASDGPQAKPR